jgi:hypothetical protein
MTGERAVVTVPVQLGEAKKKEVMQIMIVARNELH